MDPPLVREDALEVARAQIGKEIEDLQAEMADIERRIAAFRLKQNSLTTTGLLPPELLAHVFIQTRDLALAAVAGPKSSSEPPYWDWAVVTHVCSHWRTVALATPTLWSQFVLRGEKALEVAPDMLERSKAAPLRLEAALHGPQVPAKLSSLRAVLGEMHRIQELDLRMESLDMLAQFALSVPLTWPAPLIEKVYIKRSGNWPPPPVLFDGEAPNLREITMVGLYFPWNLEAANLRILRIQEFNLEVPVTRILNSLRSFTRLEELTLYYLMHEPSDSLELGEASQPVPLLSLTKLDLNFVDPALLSELVPRLHAPNLSSLKFRINAPENDDGSVSRALSALSDIARLPADEESADGVVAYAHEIVREFGYHTSKPSPSSSVPVVDADVIWRNAARWPDASILSQLHNAWAPLRRRTQSVTCSFGHDTDVATLRAWLAHPAYARTTGFELEEEFCPTLGALAPSEDAFPLPNLRTVVVRYTKFGSKCPQRFCPSADVPLGQVFREVLAQRAAYGMLPIEKLTLKGCTIEDEDLEQLRGAVIALEVSP